MTRAQRFLRPRFTDPGIQRSTGPEFHPDRWCASVSEVEALVAQIQREYILPDDAAWVVDDAIEEVEMWPADRLIVLLEEAMGESQWVWTPERDADALIALWRGIESVRGLRQLTTEQRGGRLREASLLTARGYARIDGRVFEFVRPWTAHVWREHDSWLRPPLPTFTRYLHRGAVLPIVDLPYHFSWSQTEFREAGACGGVDCSATAASVCVADEPIGMGHMAAIESLSLGALNGIPGPATEIEVDGVTRVVAADPLLRWNGTEFKCVPAGEGGEHYVWHPLREYSCVPAGEGEA